MHIIICINAYFLVNGIIDCVIILRLTIPRVHCTISVHYIYIQCTYILNRIWRAYTVYSVHCTLYSVHFQYISMNLFKLCCMMRENSRDIYKYYIIYNILVYKNIM